MISMFLAVLGLLFGFAKWLIGWAEKRDAEQEESFNKRIDDHKAELDKVHERIDLNQARLSETRDKLQSDYVKHSEIEAWRKEIREDFQNIYTKLGGIDRAVNQLIGVVQGKFKDG